MIGDIPGGALIAFCDPLKQMSIRSRSTCSGTAASDATVSTTLKAPLKLVRNLSGTPQFFRQDSR